MYFSWLAQQRKENVHPTNTDDTIQIERREVMDSYEAPRVIVFAGGTGFREINIELAHYTRHISRIVSIWDNGGSSKILRQHFPVIPIGDVRHVLMTMAHGEGRLDPVVRLFNWRLPDAGSANELRHELSRFANGTHPLIAPIEPSLKDVIVTYLQCFEAELPDNIDLSRGSIGNFVLLGAYLTHGQNMNTAIYVFRQLCSIRGNVWPVSLQSGVHIGAHLEDGQTIIGQELVTNIDRNKHRAKIKKIFFTQGLIQQEHSNSPLLVKANHLVLEALKKSNVVVFGPGSFFTSVIPHLMVEGVVDTIASLDIPKVLVSNMLECNETYNYTLEELVEVFFNVVDQFATTKRAAHAYLTHIFVNDSSGLVFLPGTDRHYLPLGNNLERFAQDGIILVAHNFEDPWHRGYHNPQYTAHLITELGKSRSIIL